jgi:hypothetical protein
MDITYLNWDKRPAIFYRNDAGYLRAGFLKTEAVSGWVSANPLEIFGEAYEMDEKEWKGYFSYWKLEPLPKPLDFDSKNIHVEPDYDDHWWRNK